MNVAIITIAGISSRFNQDIPEEKHRLKAIYYKENEQDTLLYHMVGRLSDMDRVVLVAGYKHDNLREYVNTVFPVDIKKKTIVVFNEHYEDWSSGYSLYVGIKEALRYHPDSIVFAEGDLDVDNETFRAICESKNSVITCNHDIISSNKAVIGYRNAAGKYKYVFSESHGLASIDEQFSLLFNSGQIWKFTNVDALKESIERFDKVKEKGTNLVIVADYFEKEDSEKIDFLDFKCWVNCNTREDYNSILAGWEEENEIAQR